MNVSEARSSNFTIVSSGWLLLLSGAFSFATLSAPVPVFGGLEGARAVLYNGSLAASLAAMGAALVWRKPWALGATFIASALYTADKLAFMRDTSAQRASLEELAGSADELITTFEQVSTLVSALFLAGWWSFVLYLYIKRDYFRATAAKND